VEVFVRMGDGDAGPGGCIRHDALEKYLKYLPVDFCYAGNRSALCRLRADIRTRNILVGAVVAIAVLGLAALSIFLIRRSERQKNNSSR